MLFRSEWLLVICNYTCSNQIVMWLVAKFFETHHKVKYLRKAQPFSGNLKVRYPRRTQPFTSILHQFVVDIMKKGIKTGSIRIYECVNRTRCIYKRAIRTQCTLLKSTRCSSVDFKKQFLLAFKHRSFLIFRIVFAINGTNSPDVICTCFK